MSYIGSTPTTQSFIAGTDYFNGTGSQVAFTLSRSVNSVNDIEVIVNNVEQIPSGYLVSGTTLTFSAAPSAGTSNVYVRYLSTTNLSLAIPSGTSATFNTVTATSLTATTLAATNISYTGTLTGNGGIINIGSGQVYKDAGGTVLMGTTTSPSSNNMRLSIAGRSGSASNAGMQLITDGGGGGALFSNDGAGLRMFSFTGVAGSESYTERARIDSSGNLLVGTTSATSPNPGFGFAVGSNAQLTIGHDTGSASGQYYIPFKYNTNLIGGITQNGTTAVAYNTTSDYRLKENITPLTGALARVAALRPCTYTWKSAPDETGEGFIAHELAEVCPHATTGEKDAVETYTDEDGNEATRPVYQGIDTSFLVATLTAAIQELKAIVDAQGAEIAALKGTP